MLIALRGSIFFLDGLYAVWSPQTRYNAIGSADQEALAAMYTAIRINPQMHVRQVVQCGLEAAAELDINIRPPFEIMCDLEENVAGLRVVK